jgi:RHH-type proline utilization regulon transcriptional repressor/proline dehydrogenase/delta 1-pyrroline-5-carboxylate dehydrogenase
MKTAALSANSAIIEASPVMDDLLQDISQVALQPETPLVEKLIHDSRAIEQLDEPIRARTKKLITHMRKIGHSNMIEAFLHDYGLSTQEGIAMLCLAEALLRIPDVDTADQLIEDTFSTGDWKDHLGKSESSMVNASTWALMMTGSVLSMGKSDSLSSWFGGLMKRSGEPVIRQALKSSMKMIGGQFVMGESIRQAVTGAKDVEKAGYMMSYDILGEGARSHEQAEAYVQAYMIGIREVAKGKQGHWSEKPGISIKLSALHPRYQYVHLDIVKSELMPRLTLIIEEAKKYDVAISLDAEEANRLDVELILYHELLKDPRFADFDGIGFVLQAYQKRALNVLDALIAMARETGKRIPVRLVKGAYWDNEIKYAQVMGLNDYPVFTRKCYTDLSYLICAQKMLASTDVLYAQFASHNALTAATIIELANACDVDKHAYEFQRLHGMGESLHDQLLEDGYRSRIYAPVGAHKDLLAYLIRRMLENGANTSFVHILMDRETSIEELTESPITQSRAAGAMSSGDFDLPIKLYGAHRKNSMGIDLGYRASNVKLRAGIDRCLQQKFTAPENTPITHIEDAVARSKTAFTTWRDVPVARRAECLNKCADKLEDQHDEIIALLMREGKKTIMDAVAELREAADFCRYYAREAEALMEPKWLDGPTGESNMLSLHGRGAWVAISPWNFPLAIFMGQVVAALVTGNTVLAKPAEQTPAIAALAVTLLHESGIPKDVLQLMPGDGETIGSALVAHDDIAGVVFTGSTAVAKLIQRALAAKDGAIVPLIAETGGLNAMIVDSSALLEQAVDDIIMSAFGAAGQRCSALRIVCVQEEIAQSLHNMLTGAMDAIRVGDPSKFETDLGAVIDKEAQENLLAHIEAMKRTARWWHAAPLDDAIAKTDSYVAPHVFGLNSIDQLTQEQFGPILHWVTFKAKEHERVIEAIHNTGYGLTFGLHSRVKSHIDHFMEKMHIGNRYVNRNMVGAVVGVQPFGGEGLSGTGPKAGGPFYLHRFTAERATTINTAAIGGNVELLG